jgi:alkanesulfonate monooxygenase
VDALFAPRPAPRNGRPHPNLIVGGAGGPRMSALVARYADEINITSVHPSRIHEAYDRVADACREIGRDPDQVTRSAMSGVLVGRDEAEVRERTRALMRSWGADDTDDAEVWLNERRPRWIIGTPDEARERVAQFEAAGAQRLMLQTFLPRDLEMVKLLGEIFLG